MRALLPSSLLALAACARAAPASAPGPVPAAPPAPAMPTSEAQCLALVGRKPPVQSCTATPVALGRALWISVTLSCWEDACESEDHVLLGSRPPQRLPGAGGVVVVDPSLRFALQERAEMRKDLAGNERMGDWEIYLERIDLETGVEARFADCMAPALSPGGRWFTCRDADGHGYRAPVAGGAWELIFQLDLPGRDKIDWAPMRWGRPAPTTFPSPSSIAVPTTVRTGDGDFEERIERLAWRE